MTALSILFNNHAAEGLRPGWGFSAYIRTKGAVVLFDVGADKLVLEHNATELGCNLDIVAVLVLSHEHCDHIGAVSPVLHKGLYMVRAGGVRQASCRASGGWHRTHCREEASRDRSRCAVDRSVRLQDPRAGHSGGW